MPDRADHEYLQLDTAQPIWERFFQVAPLVLIGTREPDGADDLAPKHMAGPYSWDNYFGFVCSPRHATYRNAERERAFAVSYPRPDQVVVAGLTASPRCEDDSKPTIAALQTLRGETIDAPLLVGSQAQFECALEKIVDGLGSNSLIIGRIVAARIRTQAVRRVDRDDQQVIAKAPLLAYLHPGRFATIKRSNSFPLPKGFSR
jgi:flavin reductase (DIM6/NTAB) family NADH-FMN oxidoreductase RutF